MLPMISNYLIHLVTGFAMLALFAVVYTRVTPLHEMALINRGAIAAAFSFGGALVGFALTVASAIAHNPSYELFLAWGLSGMVAQLLAYVVVARVIPHLREALEADNRAMGALMGSISIAVGLVNAGCMT
ncbi:MAG: h16 [Moraxellaceae bacterium]|nr:h16 [Moraxellaceae bacterium]